MKKSFYLLLAAALLLFIACDSTEKIALTVDTGNASRAQLPVDPLVSHVELAAFAAPITDGRMVARATVPVGERATLMVPADTNIEIFAAAMDKQQVLLPYFGLGSYYPAEMELNDDAGNTVEIWMEQMTYTYTPQDLEQYTEGAANPVPVSFRVKWTHTFTDRFLDTGLLKMQIERAINPSDPYDLGDVTEILDRIDPSVGHYDDTSPYDPNSTLQETDVYYYTVRLVVPLLDLESPAPTANGINGSGELLN